MKVNRIPGLIMSLMIIIAHHHAAAAMVPPEPAENEAEVLVVEKNAASDLATPTDSASLNEILMRKISITAEEVSLKQLLEQVAQAAQVKFELDIEALQKDDVDLNRLQSVRITNIELNEVVEEILCRQNRYKLRVGCYPHYRLHGGRLFVSTLNARQQWMEQATPGWLRSIPDAFQAKVTLDDSQQVVSLSIYRGLNDELLARVSTLSKLRELMINGSGEHGLSVAGLAHLSKLTMLERLSIYSLNNSKLGDAVLQNIAGLTTLRELDLSHCGISDTGLRQLDNQAQLTRLKLSHERLLSDGAMASIVKHRHLKSLDLGWDTFFTRDATRELVKLQELEHLNLQRHDLSPEILRFPRLKSLKISGREFNAQLAMGISRCRKLAELDLSFKQFTADAFQQWPENSCLKSLQIRCRGISDETVSDLRRMPNLADINLSSRGLTDRSLGYLSEMASLTNLSLNWETNCFSTAGLKQLAQLPNLQTLGLRIIPFHGGTMGIYLQDTVREVPLTVSIVLPMGPIRPILSERLPKGIDLLAVADALPGTQIIQGEDDFDASAK